MKRTLITGDDTVRALAKALPLKDAVLPDGVVWKPGRTGSASFERVTFGAIRIEKPLLRNAEIANATFTQCEFDGSRWSGITFDQCRFDSVMMGRSLLSYIDKCTFRRCVFAETKFVGVRWENCRLEGCAFSDIHLEDTRFISTVFAGSVLSGQANKTMFIDCQFEDVDLSTVQVSDFAIVNQTGNVRLPRVSPVIDVAAFGAIDHDARAQLDESDYAAYQKLARIQMASGNMKRTFEEDMFKALSPGGRSAVVRLLRGWVDAHQS
jgi:hypothetical protein